MLYISANDIITYSGSKLKSIFIIKLMKLTTVAERVTCTVGL